MMSGPICILAVISWPYICETETGRHLSFGPVFNSSPTHTLCPQATHDLEPALEKLRIRALAKVTFELKSRIN